MAHSGSQLPGGRMKSITSCSLLDLGLGWAFLGEDEADFCNKIRLPVGN